MFGPQHFTATFHRDAVVGQGFLTATCVPQAIGKVIGCGQCVFLLFAQHLTAALVYLPIQRQRFFIAIHVIKLVCQRRTGGQSTGMIFTQHFYSLLPDRPAQGQRLLMAAQRLQHTRLVGHTRKGVGMAVAQHFPTHGQHLVDHLQCLFLTAHIFEIVRLIAHGEQRLPVGRSVDTQHLFDGPGVQFQRFVVSVEIGVIQCQRTHRRQGIGVILAQQFEARFINKRIQFHHLGVSFQFPQRTCMHKAASQCILMLLAQAGAQAVPSLFAGFKSSPIVALGPKDTGVFGVNIAEKASAGALLRMTHQRIQNALCLRKAAGKIDAPQGLHHQSAAGLPQGVVILLVQHDGKAHAVAQCLGIAGLHDACFLQHGAEVIQAAAGRIFPQQGGAGFQQHLTHRLVDVIVAVVGLGDKGKALDLFIGGDAEARDHLPGNGGDLAVVPMAHAGEDIDDILLGVIHIAGKTLDKVEGVPAEHLRPGLRTPLHQTAVLIHAQVQIHRRAHGQTIEVAAQSCIGHTGRQQELIAVLRGQAAQQMLLQRLFPLAVKALPLQLFTAGNDPQHTGDVLHQTILAPQPYILAQRLAGGAHLIDQALIGVQQDHQRRIALFHGVSQILGEEGREIIIQLLGFHILDLPQLLAVFLQVAAEGRHALFRQVQDLGG